jgi:hypothetical protein
MRSVIDFQNLHRSRFSQYQTEKVNSIFALCYKKILKLQKSNKWIKGAQVEMQKRSVSYLSVVDERDAMKCELDRARKHCRELEDK